MQAEVSVDILTQIVQSVFETMMSLDASPCDAPWSRAGDRMTSLVYLTGDWNGAVMLECTPQQACQFAGRILCMDPPETADDDVRDVLGELANMVGGNMKSGMSTGVRLSMPSVMIGRDYGRQGVRLGKSRKGLPSNAKTATSGSLCSQPRNKGEREAACFRCLRRSLRTAFTGSDLQSIFGIHIDFLRGVQGAFFLRKKALSCVLSVYSNSENAITPP